MNIFSRLAFWRRRAAPRINVVQHTEFNPSEEQRSRIQAIVEARRRDAELVTRGARSRATPLRRRDDDGLSIGASPLINLDDPMPDRSPSHGFSGHGGDFGGGGASGSWDSDSSSSSSSDSSSSGDSGGSSD
jgi:uncharacterized membrane protein YgcG